MECEESSVGVAAPRTHSPGRKTTLRSCCERERLTHTNGARAKTLPITRAAEGASLLVHMYGACAPTCAAHLRNTDVDAHRQVIALISKTITDYHHKVDLLADNRLEGHDMRPWDIAVHP